MNVTRTSTTAIAPSASAQKRAVTTDTANPAAADDSTARDQSLVWIDARKALILTWADGNAAIQRLTSDVPAHRRSTGHVRHDPNVRHGGGGGSDQEAGEPRRLEHLKHYLQKVEAAIPSQMPVTIVGPGETREHLEHLVRQLGEEHRVARDIDSQPAGRLTEHQLVARLREMAGAPARRATVGAWRWTGPQPEAPSGLRRPPRRSAAKLAQRTDEVVANEEMAQALEEEGER